MKKYFRLSFSYLLICSLILSGFVGEFRAAAMADAPVTVHQISGEQHISGIYYGSVDISLSVFSSGAGIAETRYSLDNGSNWSIYTEPLTFSDKMVYHLLYQSIDVNQRMEEPKVVDFTIKKDKFPPETTVHISGAQGLNSYYTSPVTISLSSVDEHSFIDYSEYSLDGGHTWSRFTGPFTLDDRSNNIFHYRSRDIDGNLEKEKKHKAYLDMGRGDKRYT